MYQISLPIREITSSQNYESFKQVEANFYIVKLVLYVERCLEKTTQMGEACVLKLNLTSFTLSPYNFTHLYSPKTKMTFQLFLFSYCWEKEI
jgi:hypothetical protein